VFSGLGIGGRNGASSFINISKTTFSFFSEICFITSSVNFSQPIWLWLAGFPHSTVKIAFSRKTHCSLQIVKSQFKLGFIHKLLSNSL